MSEDNESMPSNNKSQTVARASVVDWAQKYEEQRKRAGELLIVNKRTLFEVLAMAGITNVVVSFDGYGDSGQIETIEAQTDEISTELPDERIEFLAPVWESTEIQRQAHTVREAIESVCYSCLKQAHCGWENNDGAYGDFTFNVEERVITLDYNERYTTSDNYTHEF